MNGSSHPDHENVPPKSPYYRAIFIIFIGNPMIGTGDDGDLS
jgi:hypothetical protein